MKRNRASGRSMRTVSGQKRRVNRGSAQPSSTPNTIWPGATLLTSNNQTRVNVGVSTGCGSRRRIRPFLRGS
jgi:hypothetical protein